MDVAQVEALVAWYARAALFHSIKTLCETESDRTGGNARLVFWSAFAVLKEGNASQAIRRLYDVQRRREMDYPATVALIAAHRSAQLVDNEAVAELEARIKSLDEQNAASEDALLLAAKFQWHMGNSSAARRLVRTLLKANGQNPQAHALAGWIALTRSGTSSRDQEMRDSAIKFFDRAIAVAPSEAERDVDALLGKAQFLVRVRDFPNALATLTEAIVHYGAWYRPALVEKARVELLMGNWELAHQSVERVIAEDPSDIAALGLAALIALAYRGSAPLATRYLSKLVSAIGARESHNARAMYAVAMPLSRLAGEHRSVLEQTLELMRMAKFEQPRSSEFAGEYGHQLLLRGALDDAAAVFEEAGSMEESNVIALHGRIEIQLRQGHLKDAAEQLEVFSMIQASIGESAEVSYMKAVLLEKQGESIDVVLPALRHALALHMQGLGAKEGDGTIVPNTLEWFACFDPSFLTSVARALLRLCDEDGGEFAGAQRLQGTERECLSDATNLLKHVVELAPGIQPAKLLLARCLLLAQDTTRARRLAQSVCSATHRELLELGGSDLASSFSALASPGGPSSSGGSGGGASDTAQASDAYMLLAQIDLADGHHPETLKSLEEALSLDFNVRSRPLYHLLKAHVHQARGDLETARSILQDALELPGVRPVKKGKKKTQSGRASGVRFAGVTAPSSSSSTVSSGDRVAVFSRLATVLAHLGRLGEADLIVAEAMLSFQGTPFEVHIVVVKAEVAIKRGQVDKAMRYLKRIRADSPAYVRAQLVKAAVFLKQRRNKRKYIACYQELVDATPTKQSHILLGEANMRIQEPDAAIRAFEAALALDPEDALLATRVGEALVSTHDYDRAIEYYKTALRASPRKHSLRHQLAQLYAKLQQHDAATALLQAAVGETEADDEEGEASEPAAVAFQRTRTLALLAKVHLEHSRTSAEEERRSTRTACPPAKVALERAQTVATRALRRLQAGGLASSDRQLEARELAASACYELGVYAATNERDDATAVAQYAMALRHDEAHEAAMLALARAHVAAGRMEEGRDQCLRLLKMSDAHIEASSLLADIMLQEGNLDQATLHFQRILEKRPAQWQALARVTKLLWRTGRIKEVPARLRAAKLSSPRAMSSAGFHYCCGIYHRCAHDPAKAVRAFNLARRDGEWGFEAVSNMVEVYLGVGVGGTLPDVVIREESAVTPPSVLESVGVAQSLMQEPVMLSKQSTAQYRILLAYVAVCKGERSRELETATRDVMQLFTDDKTNVAALLAACCGLLVNRSEGKAKNNLKRIYKMRFDETHYEAFEQAWLLLAVIYMKSGKQSNAQGLCQKCVQYNQSCSKAYELLGEINERSLAYRDAAEAYLQAFLFSHELSAEVGFKLAFNYLKADQFTKAIDVCHKVLAETPEFPRIREEILLVARKSLRL